MGFISWARMAQQVYAESAVKYHRTHHIQSADRPLICDQSSQTESPQTASGTCPRRPDVSIATPLPWQRGVLAGTGT